MDKLASAVDRLRGQLAAHCTSASPLAPHIGALAKEREAARATVANLQRCVTAAISALNVRRARYDCGWEPAIVANMTVAAGFLITRVVRTRPLSAAAGLALGAPTPAAVGMCVAAPTEKEELLPTTYGGSAAAAASTPADRSVYAGAEGIRVRVPHVEGDSAGEDGRPNGLAGEDGRPNGLAAGAGWELEVLFVREGDEYKLPGGRMQGREDSLAAALREALEECGGCLDIDAMSARSFWLSRPWPAGKFVVYAADCTETGFREPPAQGACRTPAGGAALPPADVAPADVEPLVVMVRWTPGNVPRLPRGIASSFNGLVPLLFREPWMTQFALERLHQARHLG